MRTFGELFCGPGGMALGLQRAGLVPLWAVDNDRWACATYRRNICAHVICAAAEDTDFGALRPVSGLTFGFPCNDFSAVGEKRGVLGYYGGLYHQAVRALNEIRPEWFIAENVPGLLSNSGTHVMEAFGSAGAGYTVSVHVYRFEGYGVPQRRHRVVGVGLRADLGAVFRPPAPTYSVPVSAEEALRGVEAVPWNNERTRHPRRTVEMLSCIPEGGNAWHPNVPEHLRLNVPRCTLSLIYRRLKRGEPAYTVTGSGGGGTHMYHWAEPRALTNRERARLQGFPDDFIFEGPKEAVRKQIGMAVPPSAAECIGCALVACLEGRRYSSVEPSRGELSAKHTARLFPMEA